MTKNRLAGCALTASTFLVAAIVLFNAALIEVLNMEAGGILPRTELRSDGGMTKWRDAFFINERFWRMHYGIPENRPLTSAEQSEMRRDVAKARTHNALKGAVQSSGICLYLLVPLLLLLSNIRLALRCRSTKQILLGAVPLLIGIGAGVLMFSRAYFTNLGW